MASVSAHACARWQQRVNPHASVSDAHAAIMEWAGAIDHAAKFAAGADVTLVIGNGARLKLKGDVVATVLGSRHVRRCYQPLHGEIAMPTHLVADDLNDGQGGE